MKIIFIIITIIVKDLTVFQNIDETSMPIILKNENIEIKIDTPLENYNFSRFDWTGKIISVKYKGITVSGIESTNDKQENRIGKGFYNEFGIERPLAYNEVKDGEYFPKIGIGVLKKNGANYDFRKEYEIEPAKFNVSTKSNRVIIECKAENVIGYSYILKKEIELTESGFIIHYQLKNTGIKTIVTDEYTHNFISINNQLIGRDYILRFPFILDHQKFNASVNPENMVEFTQDKVLFSSTPNEQFFFGNLTGDNDVNATWELINTKTKIGISETGSFTTNKVNLWGWKHVISPELYIEISVEPGQSQVWTRTYKIFEI